MSVEIERKFLVDPAVVALLPAGTFIKQGYIDTAGLISVRARIRGDRGYLTVKGPASDDGLVRSEYEYPIPLEDAHAIIGAICDGGVVEKVRHEIVVGERVWEVDVFTGANAGLVLAEVELPERDSAVSIPDWALEEVTGDVRYYNMRLAVRPWPDWASSPDS